MPDYPRASQHAAPKATAHGVEAAQPRPHRAARPRRRQLARAARLLGRVLLVTGISGACAAAAGDSGRLWPNVDMPTLGGVQFWTDVAYDDGWKVQRHAWTRHARLIDPAGVRRAWGAEDACRGELRRRAHPADAGVVCGTPDGTDSTPLHTSPPIAEAQAHAEHQRALVVLLHGLGRSHVSMGPVRERLELEGYEVLSFEYASTRADVEDHAAALAGLLSGLDEPRELSFVTHSLGGIVLRELTRDPAAPWRARHTLGHAVTLAAPHQGAAVARQTRGIAPARWILGPCLTTLGDGTAAALPEPGLPFATIAGIRGTAGGWNPWVEGDDDGLVAANEATLPGATLALEIEVLHTFVMSDERVLDIVVAFLGDGD